MASKAWQGHIILCTDTTDESIHQNEWVNAKLNFSFKKYIF